jgi:hypothetical protein
MVSFSGSIYVNNEGLAGLPGHEGRRQMWLASINMSVRTVACEKNKLDRVHAASPDGNLPKLVTQFL